MPRTRRLIVFSRRKQLALRGGVLSDRVYLTAGLFVHGVWDCRAIKARLRLQVSSWKWHAGRKWTGVRTCTLRKWKHELSVEGLSKPDEALAIRYCPLIARRRAVLFDA
jgi:hypothetical protein